MSSSNMIRGIKMISNINSPGDQDQPATFVKPAARGSSHVGGVTTITQDELNANTGWLTSDLSRRIGLPLKIKKDASYLGNEYSRTINNLFANLDTSSPDFGKYTVHPVRGAVIIAREDGKDLRELDVEIVLSSVQRWICGLLSKYDVDPVGIKSQCHAVIEPRTFRLAWRVLCMMKAHAERHALVRQAIVTAACPVVLEDKNHECENCGKKDGETGKAEEASKLLQCGAWKLAWYCNRECQKAHWKRHKPLCNLSKELRRFGSF